MKDQQKFIKSIVLLTATIYLFGDWIKGFLGSNIAAFITSISTISLIGYGLYRLG